jgi:zinc transporter ZupT
MSLDAFKWLSVLLIFIVTLLAALFPFLNKYKLWQPRDFAKAEALAAGVFLGAGLIHMLGDAAAEFSAQSIQYPLAFLLAGSMFLLLLWFEHLGRRLYSHEGIESNGFAILAVLMLSIHSLLAGTVLGISGSFSVMIMILVAILAHKWAASFALSVQLNKSQLSLGVSIAWFSVFAVMFPIGVGLGSFISDDMSQYPLLAPIFYSLAAGTFLYLGTLHGLKRAILVEKCCDLKNFSFVILGFGLMAVVAIWT